jgi:predicted TIM-barrel fold metal-dependent hydrolase
MLPLVDPHHHLWDADLHRYPWLTRADSRIPRRYLVDDLLADAATTQLTKSVHVQGDIARDQSAQETAWLQAIADQHGFPHGIVAYASLADPEVEDMLAAHAQHANMRGIRQILNPDQCERPDYLTDPAWQAGYKLLERFGLSFDLQALPDQMPAAAELAAKYPRIPMIVNHTGMPRDQSPAGVARWRDGMRELAAVPHVYVKISGFGMFDADWTDDSIRPFVLETIALFGVERALFASNFPVDRAWASFERIFESFETLTADLPAADRMKLFQTNAERAYRL